MDKRCINCGNLLGAFESRGDICNECLLIPHEDESLAPYDTGGWDGCDADDPRYASDPNF